MTTPTTKSVSEVLEEAADLLSKPGAWTQGAYNSEGCHCVLGAMCFVADVDPEAPWGANLASDAREPLAETIGIASWEIVGWNDTPGRTQDEVVSKLREAAALAREQGK